MVRCPARARKETFFYHGSTTPPSVIRVEGLDDPNPNPQWSFIWLTKDYDYAKTYGKYVYRVDLSKIPHYQRRLHYLGASPHKGEEWSYATGHSIIPPIAIALCDDLPK